jgi:hypothetical protein
MGYRSEVTILFYAEEKDFPLLKLWFAANVASVMNEHWDFDDTYKPDEFERGEYKGYAIGFGDVKWYESYPEVQAIEEAWELFRDTFGDKNEDTTFGAEFARIGEDYGDVEYKDTYHTQNLLSIVRHADY